MDLVSSLRKEGTSRGGVNFSWSDVSTSVHRENYLGHSLMAPVGRWQNNKDLSWYAKADSDAPLNGETNEQKRARERKEEIRAIKEAEEDALAKALGLPVKDRTVTSANAIAVPGDELRKAVKDSGEFEHEDADQRKAFGDNFIGHRGGIEQPSEVMLGEGDPERADRTERRDREKSDRRRDRSRDGERRRERSRDGERRRRHHHRHRSPDDEGHRERRRRRSRSPDRKERRHRSRSPDRRHKRERTRSLDVRRERSPDYQRRDKGHNESGRQRRQRSPDRERVRERSRDVRR